MSRGQALLELSVCAPVVMLLTLGTVAGGQVIDARAGLDAATNAAAAAAARAPDPASAQSAAHARFQSMIAGYPLTSTRLSVASRGVRPQRPGDSNRDGCCGRLVGLACFCTTVDPVLSRRGSTRAVAKSSGVAVSNYQTGRSLLFSRSPSVRAAAGRRVCRRRNNRGQPRGRPAGRNGASSGDGGPQLNIGGVRSKLPADARRNRSQPRGCRHPGRRGVRVRDSNRTRSPALK